MKTTKLSVEKREKIFYYLTLNKSCREIGLQLGRSHTTISREIKRNKTEGEYSPSRAEIRTMVRRRKCGRSNKIDNNIDLFEEVFQRIFTKWSPEQVSGYLKGKYKGQLQMQISHESIYKYIYAKAKGELKKHLLKYLRQKGRKNINRKLSHEKRGQIPDAVPIHERPKEVEDRQAPGHWE